jgi:thiosulfate reductase cytochrome b subunit
MNVKVFLCCFFVTGPTGRYRRKLPRKESAIYWRAPSDFRQTLHGRQSHREMASLAQQAYLGTTHIVMLDN